MYTILFQRVIDNEIFLLSLSKELVKIRCVALHIQPVWIQVADFHWEYVIEGHEASRSKVWCTHSCSFKHAFPKFSKQSQISVVHFTCACIIIGYTWKWVSSPAAFQGVRSRMLLEGWRRRARQLKLSLKGTAPCGRKESVCSDRACRSLPLTSRPIQPSLRELFLVVNLGGRDHHWFSPDCFVLQEGLERLS